MFGSLRRTLRKQWRTLSESPPGRRFQDRYWDRQRSGKSSSFFGLNLALLAGVGLMLVGIVLMPAPGPGWATFIVGLALISGEFLSVAKAMDWAELKIRDWDERFDRWWEQASWLGRGLVLLLVGSISFVVGYGTGLLL